jgi:hypothetical protein
VAIKEFPASLDRTAKICTIAVCVVLAAVTAFTGSLWVPVVSLPLLLLCYAFAPRGYGVGPGSVTVRRLVGAGRIPRASITAARPAGKSDLAGAIRLWGNGGLFGYYGLFRTSALGVCRWDATNRKHAVVLLTGGRPVVISPDDREGFLAALGVPNLPLPVTPGRVTGRERATMIAGGSALALVAGGAVSFALLYSPGPPDYTLTRDSLAIHDRFYPVTVPANSVDLGGVRVVDISAEPAWRPTARTNGFANAHYRAGWFRVAGGGKVRLYRADSTRLVLLPRTGGAEPVLLEVADPERFRAELRTNWTR